MQLVSSILLVYLCKNLSSALGEKGLGSTGQHLKCPLFTSVQPQGFLLAGRRCEGCPGAQPVAGSACVGAWVLHETRALCQATPLPPSLP